MATAPFWTLNVDSLLWSVLMGLVFLVSFRDCREVPGSARSTKLRPGFSKYAEGVVTMVDNSVKDSMHVSSPLIAPLAITIFCLMLFMNAIDLFPVDWWSTVVAERGVGLEQFQVGRHHRSQHHLRHGPHGVSAGAVLQLQD